MPRDNKTFVESLVTANVDRKLLANHPYVDNVVDGTNVPITSILHQLTDGPMEWAKIHKKTIQIFTQKSVISSYQCRKKGIEKFQNTPFLY